jgi:hypothetical protein
MILKHKGHTPALAGGAREVLKGKSMGRRFAHCLPILSALRALRG